MNRDEALRLADILEHAPMIGNHLDTRHLIIALRAYAGSGTEEQGDGHCNVCDTWHDCNVAMKCLNPPKLEKHIPGHLGIAHYETLCADLRQELQRLRGELGTLENARQEVIKRLHETADELLAIHVAVMNPMDVTIHTGDTFTVQMVKEFILMSIKSAAHTPGCVFVPIAMVRALVDHNDNARSFFQISNRIATELDTHALQTNFGGFAESTERMLKEHHQTTNQARATLATLPALAEPQS